MQVNFAIFLILVIIACNKIMTYLQLFPNIDSFILILNIIMGRGQLSQLSNFDFDPECKLTS